MSQTGNGPKFGGLALAVVIAVTVVAVRWHRAQQNAPPIRPVTLPAAGGVDKVSAALVELADGLDALEAQVNCAEDGTLPVEDRLQVMLDALAGFDPVNDALLRLTREVETFVPATGADADRFNALRPRMKELAERWGRLGERLEAVRKQIHEEVERLWKE